MKRVAFVLVLLCILGYGYYSYLAYQVYSTLKSLDQRTNPVATSMCKNVIKTKYRYSIAYFIVDLGAAQE